MKNSVFWDMMTPCGSFKDRSFGGTYRLHLQVENSESLWFTASMYRETNWEENLLQRYTPLYCIVCYREDIVDKPLSFVECDDSPNIEDNNVRCDVFTAETVWPSETSVLTKTTRRYFIPEDSVLQQANFIVRKLERNILNGSNWPMSTTYQFTYSY
jgi:hypothetical protein